MYYTFCDMDPDAQLRNTLKQHGQNITTARSSVFLALKNEEPLTMGSLIERCEEIDRASVYRTVALFEKLGIVQRLQTGWKYRLELTDAFHEHHHHATCLVCGTVQVAPEDSIIEQHLKRLAGTLGFQLERHQLELQGYCSACQSLLED
jgi:Fe2+ or Zn2+ uptake regulation protein